MADEPQDPDKTLQEDWTNEARPPKTQDPDKTVKEDWTRRAPTTAHEADKTLQEDWIGGRHPDKTIQEDWTSRGRAQKNEKPDKTVQENWIRQTPPKRSARLLVNESELVAWLSAQFQTYPECSTVTVEKVTRLDVPDAEGCNWSRTLILRTGGVSPRVYVHAYAAIIEKGRKAFILKTALAR